MTKVTDRQEHVAISSPWPLTEQEQLRVAEILSAHQDIAPPYTALREDDAVLMHRYFTGTHPNRARLMVLKSRNCSPAGEVN